MKTEPNTQKEVIIENYKIKQTIGKGTFGKVKLGVHIETNEKVAIKILEKRKMVEANDKERVFREMSIIKEFNHMNIVKVLRLIETSTHFYIVMEYCKNGELFNYIVKKRRLSEDETSYFYYQLINGLEYIHSQGVVHRDLKPENLLLGQDKIIKIIDFGLSNYFERRHLITPCGSPCYASPEMVSGNSYNGFGIDVWSTGIILFAMLCGYLPFENPDNEKLYQSILECQVDYPRHVSPIGKDLMKKILVTDPTRRIKIHQIKKHQFYLNGEKIFKTRFGQIKEEQLLCEKIEIVDNDKPASNSRRNDKGKREEEAGVQYDNNKKDEKQHIVSRLDEEEMAYMPLKTEIPSKEQQKKLNIRNMLKNEAHTEIDQNVQTVPNGSNTQRHSTAKHHKNSNSTKKKEFNLASLIGLNSMRLTTHSPIKKNHLITRQVQGPSKISNSIMINNAVINVNMIEPNIILANMRKNRTKSSTRDHKDNIIKSLITRQDQKRNANKEKEHKGGISLNSLCYTEECVKKPRPNSKPQQKPLTGNKKVLTNFFENYHPTYLQTDTGNEQKHSKFKSLKLNYYVNSRQKKATAYNYTNTTNINTNTNPNNTTNTITNIITQKYHHHQPPSSSSSSKTTMKSKNISQTIKTIREQVKNLYLKDFMKKKSIK